jgi:predicted nucleotidyltransferase
MDLRRPFTSVTPTLDGDALAVLAGGDVEMSGREVHRLAGRGSEHGMRKVLDRLAAEGVVLRRSAGQANLYKLNRDHLAAAAIESLAGLRHELLRRMRAAVDAWGVAAQVVVLFGSAARGTADRGSDIDLLVVRQDAVDSEDPTWRAQLTSLADAITAWTGNDTRVLEYSRAEYAEAAADGETVLADALRDGIEIGGSLRSLRRLSQARG